MSFARLQRLLVLFVTLSSGGVMPLTASAQNSTYTTAAASGVQTLQTWYEQSSGMYRSPTGWWNAANAITLLVNYSRVTGTTQYLSAVSNTYANANAANGSQNFITSANDDEGWWALAWIDAYDLTQNRSYLKTAETIFSDLTTQWDTSTCGGGVWWSKNLTTSAYKNAITNEIFLKIAASLANRVTDPTAKSQYLGWAEKEWQWFQNSGMINAQNLINDGLDATNPSACTNNGETTWTYNQGVIQGGLVELSKADGNHAWISSAQKIANAAMTILVTTNGVLEEPSISGPDQPQFKGIFMRNLMELNGASPQALYKTFAETNANSILANDISTNETFGVYWQGPFDSADATRQTSALDAFVSAIAIDAQCNKREVGGAR
jgi:predicted alpha-1,6-mannanase (GH76 family)